MSAHNFRNHVELQSLENVPLAKSYYDDNTSYDPGNRTIQRKKTWRSRFSGWRGGVIASIAVASLVLLLNIILAIIAATAWDPIEGIATAFTGDCTVAARTTTALHLLINLLSSLLLGASNYCMQRLVAPTRKEIDKAHAQKKWLDIGMPSIRNLPSIGRSRILLWGLLALSSIPLHFVYNSVVFETIGANTADFLIVAPEFFTQKDNWHYDSYNATTDNYITRLQDSLLDDKYLDRTVFDNLTANECISRYTRSFISSGAGFGVPIPQFREQYDLNATNTVLRAESGSGDLNLGAYNVEFAYCLSKIIPAKCQVQFSQTIVYIVITCNILKIAGMLLIMLRLNQEPIVTIGDAVKSFLQRPDNTTEGCCLMSRRNVDTVWKVPSSRLNQRFQPSRRQIWASAVSRRRWIFSLVLCFSALITAGAFGGVINHMKQDSFGPSGTNGFGKVSIEYLIDVRLPFGEDSIIPYVLLANLPQAVITFIYLIYNGLFTAMVANREWSTYAVKRASLRVTSPSPTQRSTYFLQLPYTFSVPLLIASVLLHWFVSQTIFLARIAIYKDGTMVNVSDRLQMLHHQKSRIGAFTGVGYSDTALWTTIGWGSVLVVSALLAGNVCTYPKGLPIGGTNSAVISAACHIRYEGDESDKTSEDVADHALQWGVTVPGGRDAVGHCSFSSGPVDAPRLGSLYAGIRART